MSFDTADDFASMKKLRDAFPLNGIRPETDDGRRWKRRMDESESYFKRYSIHWNEDRDLLVNFKAMMDEFGTYVAIAYPIIANRISDVYFRNPDPFIQDKGGNKDLSRILTDVIRSVHMECDTETEMRHAFIDQAWASFGMVVASFKQWPANAGDLVMEPDEPPAGDADQAQDQQAAVAPQPQPMRPATMPVHNGQFDPTTGDPIFERQPTGETVEPTDQKVLVQRLSPWRCRFDPRGRRWDMTDHSWWAYESTPYLSDLMRDTSISRDDKARLMAYFGAGGSAFVVDGVTATGYHEQDPEFIRVRIYSIWNRRDHMIYRWPIGANFTFDPQPWDEEWERADMFPCHYMPVNKVPEDEKNEEGFIGLSWMRIIGEHVKNINKLQGLIVNALGKVIDVYVAWKGMVPPQIMGKIQDGAREFKIVEIDPEAYQKYAAQQPDKQIDIRSIIHLLDVGETKDMQHMQKIDHEFGLIAQEMGQGPAERGGVSKSDTATESLGIQQGLSRRMSSDRNDAGKHYNAVTRKIFIIIQARQTLSMRYQMVSAGFNNVTWQQFTDPHTTLKNIDLHFDYATGSTEPQTREQQFALRERMATILMPIFQAQQDTRSMMKLAQELIEPLGLLDADGFFNDAASQIAMQLLTILMGLGKGKIGDIEITADNEAVIQQIPELISKLAQAILTPQQLAQVMGVVTGATQQPEGQQGVGSIAKAPSPGQASFAAGAAGSAAAGKSSGIQFTEQLPAPALQNTPT